MSWLAAEGVLGFAAIAARRGDPELAARLVAGAHEVCPYSNATRGNVEVTLTANGRPVD